MNKQQLIRWISEKQLIRLCAYPLIMSKYVRAKNDYACSENPAKIRLLHNSESGKRCVIVGNGPSLTTHDLDLLYARKELCFGMNHIYDLFSCTKWRPNYYICYDRDFIRSEYKALLNLPVEKILIEYSKAPKKKIQKKNVYYYISDYVFNKSRGKAITSHVCTDLSQNASFVTNTTHLCIEFAIYMGFKEIILIGVDHDYSFGYGKNHAKGIKEGKQNDENHYHNCDLEVSVQKYLQYKEYADCNGIRILNATKGGKLEVFERADLEKILASY